jgi:5-methylcytosine-specific restriction endonuclease McrA
MTERQGSGTQSDPLTWWKNKLARMDDRTFVMPRWGPHILDVLLAADEGRIEVGTLNELSVHLGVPLKFVPRAVASVTRLGIVTAQLRVPTIVVAIHRDRLSRRKIAMGRERRRLSEAERESIKAESGHLCACCGKRFKSSELVLDHLIPLALLGSDEPANLVAMSRKCNAKKWDRLLRGDLKLYRQEKVRGRFGVRFIAGKFWPVINGRVRCSWIGRSG